MNLHSKPTTLIACTAALVLSAGLTALAPAENKEPPKPALKEKAATADQEKKSQPPRGTSVTFLGIAATDIIPVVREQLDLPPGTGIAVGHVLPDSPAQNAGLKEHDILTKVDDQILVSPEQLQILIRMKKPGDEITLTYLRATNKRTAKIKLATHRFAETVTPPPGMAPRRPFNRPPSFPSPRDPQHDWQDHWKQLEKQWGHNLNEWWEEHGDEWIDHFRDQLEEAFKDFDAESWKPQMDKWRDEVRKHTEDHSRQFFHHEAVITDDDGTLKITVKDGRKHVHATDPKGNVLFDGYCDTDAERNKVPADILKKVDSIEIQSKFNRFKPPRSPRGRDKDAAPDRPRKQDAGLPTRKDPI